jgi:hypothetical protein
MVDLPAPFGPIRPTIVPGGMSKLTLETARNAPKSLQSSRTTIDNARSFRGTVFAIAF